MQYSEITVKQVKKLKREKPAAASACDKLLEECGGQDPVYPGRGRPSFALVDVRDYLAA